MQVKNMRFSVPKLAPRVLLGKLSKRKSDGDPKNTDADSNRG